MKFPVKTLGLLLGLAALAHGCAKPRMIPNTKINDTKENRALLKVIAEYRDAMVRKNAAKILALAHGSYLDNAGTPEPQDDVDYARLPTVLKERFAKADRIRYTIQFQRVDTKGRMAQVDAWIDATFVYNHPNHTPRYKRISDYHRYRLISEDGRWLFVGGL